MTEPTPPHVLRIELPGVVSWSRPRRMRGGVRYPPAYARDRDAWAAVVASAVRERQWRPQPAARYRVEVALRGGGKRNLDRVCTAVLDALQAGRAVRDDCLVDALTAARQAAPARGAPARGPLGGRRCFTAAQRPRTRLDKAGVQASSCRGNVAWWRPALARLRGSLFFRPPPWPARQLAPAL